MWCAWQPNFWRKKTVTPKLGFFKLLENFVLNFFGNWSVKFIFIAVFLHKSHTWEKFGSWDMGENSLGHGVAMVKNGCGHSSRRTQKLAVCQERINGINWFLWCWWKFRKAKSYFWVVVVKNGRGLFGLGNLLYLKNELMK